MKRQSEGEDPPPAQAGPTQSLTATTESPPSAVEETRAAAAAPAATPAPAPEQAPSPDLAPAPAPTPAPDPPKARAPEPTPKEPAPKEPAPEAPAPAQAPSGCAAPDPDHNPDPSLAPASARMAEAAEPGGVRLTRRSRAAHPAPALVPRSARVPQGKVSAISGPVAAAKGPAPTPDPAPATVPLTSPTQANAPAPIPVAAAPPRAAVATDEARGEDSINVSGGHAVPVSVVRALEAEWSAKRDAYDAARAAEAHHRRIRIFNKDPNYEPTEPPEAAPSVDSHGLDNYDDENEENEAHDEDVVLGSEDTIFNSTEDDGNSDDDDVHIVQSPKRQKAESMRKGPTKRTRSQIASEKEAAKHARNNAVTGGRLYQVIRDLQPGQRMVPDSAFSFMLSNRVCFFQI